MQTGKDILSKEAVEVAAQWWADSLKRPQKDNGDNSENGSFASALSLFLAVDNTPSDEQIADFKAALIVEIENDALWGDSVLLVVDYHPEGALAIAARTAKIDDSCFSWKTRMMVGAKEINVKCGYGAEWQTIWKAE